MGRRIVFGIHEKSGKVSPMCDDALWDERRDYVKCSFLGMCWRLWKWRRRVGKAAARHRRLQRENGSGYYIFRERHTFNIETEV